MQTISEIRALLNERGLKPKRKLGQNFLYDKNQLVKLIAAADVKAGDVVLEVGPGTGTLTEALLEAGAETIACEIDDDMSDILEERIGDRLTLIRGDCLGKSRTLNPAIIAAIMGREFKLIANLPYQIASPLMVALLVDHPNCLAQFITIQKEVADRLLAVPSTKAYGPLTIIIQAFAEVKKIAVLKPTCFWPPPKVDSAMVSLSPSPFGRGARDEGLSDKSNNRTLPDLSTPDHRRAFARFVTNLFTKRRKQLGTIFGRDRTFPETITPDMRPEVLTIRQHIALWQAMV